MIDSGFLVSLISCNTFLALVFVNCASTNITPSAPSIDRKSTRLNSSHGYISYAVFCLKKKKKTDNHIYQIPRAPTGVHTPQRHTPEDERPRLPQRAEHRSFIKNTA